MAYDIIDYVAFASPTGNASDWGDLTYEALMMQSAEDSTRGITWSGYTASNVNSGRSMHSNAINYWSLSSTGNASAFGNAPGLYCSSNGATVGKYSGHSVSNGTRAEKWGGTGYSGYSGFSGY